MGGVTSQRGANIHGRGLKSPKDDKTCMKESTEKESTRKKYFTCILLISRVSSATLLRRTFISLPFRVIWPSTVLKRSGVKAIHLGLKCILEREGTTKTFFPSEKRNAASIKSNENHQAKTPWPRLRELWLFSTGRSSPGSPDAMVCASEKCAQWQCSTPSGWQTLTLAGIRRNCQTQQTVNGRKTSHTWTYLDF